MLRRPGIYVAAIVVGAVGVAVGLAWWAAAIVAIAALLGGAGLAAWLFAAEARRTVADGSTSAGIEGQSIFRLEGEYWTISYRGGALIHLPRSKGLRYIDRLLRSPGVEVHVLDLAAMHQPAAVPAREEGLHVEGGAAQPVIDQAALRSYRLRVEDLRDAIEEAERNADPERGARAREELEQLMDEIRRATRPDGTPRALADETERARVNVTKAIRKAIDKVEELDPSLGHHLDHDIRTGTYCSYKPDAATAPVWVR